MVRKSKRSATKAGRSPEPRSRDPANDQPTPRRPDEHGDDHPRTEPSARAARQARRSAGVLQAPPRPTRPARPQSAPPAHPPEAPPHLLQPRTAITLPVTNSGVRTRPRSRRAPPSGPTSRPGRDNPGRDPDDRRRTPRPSRTSAGKRIKFIPVNSDSSDSDDSDTDYGEHPPRHGPSFNRRLGFSDDSPPPPTHRRTRNRMRVQGSPDFDLAIEDELDLNTEAPLTAAGAAGQAIASALQALTGAQQAPRASPFRELPQDDRFVPLSQRHPWALSKAMLNESWSGGCDFVRLAGAAHIDGDLPPLAARDNTAASREANVLVPILARVADCRVFTTTHAPSAKTWLRMRHTLEAVCIFAERRLENLLAAQRAVGAADTSEAAITAKVSLAALDREIGIASRRARLGAAAQRLVDSAIQRQVLARVIPDRPAPAPAPTRGGGCAIVLGRFW